MTDPGWDIPGVPRSAPEDDQPTDAAARESAVPGTTARERAARKHADDGTAARKHADHGTAARKHANHGTAARKCGHGTTVRESAARETAATSADPLVSASASTGFSEGAFSDCSFSAGDVSSDSGARPGSPGEALELLSAALDYLAHANAADWSAGLQADCLRALAVAESQHSALHAKALAAFSAPGAGLAGDGHRSPRMWLTWQTQATRRAAAGKVAWMRQLAIHPVIAQALADGSISLSWSRQLAEWSDGLPEDYRDTADGILLAAAGAGATLSELSQIAEELVRRHASADDSDDGFEDRTLRLTTTFEAAGRLEGDLTPRCTAAVDAVLDSLSARRGPEDTRTIGQRMHDALEEACTRLIASDCLPQRAAQPVRLELNINLDELANGGLRSSAGPGVTCDAAIQSTIIGTVDDELLPRLADQDFRAQPRVAAGAQARDARFGAILEQAIALLSGPAGKAAALRRGLPGIPAAGLSLPLDVAGTVDTIPVHLRRAVRKRDQHCRFPGCDMSPAACDVHHIVHRKDGGRHALTNLMLLCRFHHLIAIHRWGWQVTLHADGTTSAASPDSARVLHSHRPDHAAVHQAS